jgi:RNA polymerase sigma-70 factor (ECF subfamily)
MEFTKTADGKLVEAALRGDADSFMLLAERFYPAMVAIGLSILGDHHLAEDAAQESLAKACRNIRSLKEPDCFAAWLANICRNQARDMLRQSPPMESLGDRDVAEVIAERDPDADLMCVAIGRLPAEAKEIIYLRYYDEMSYERISAVLGISEQAVDGRLRRARQVLREHMTREAELEGHRDA